MHPTSSGPAANHANNADKLSLAVLWALFATWLALALALVPSALILAAPGRLATRLSVDLTATVKRNVDHAALAVKGGDVVGDVVQTMESIRSSSREVQDIVNVIDGIAFQTNILALNAAVDAGGRLVDEAGQAMRQIVGSVQRVADIMTAIPGASQERRDGIEQVRDSIREIELTTRQTAELVEQSADAAETRCAHASSVARAVGTLRQAEVSA